MNNTTPYESLIAQKTEQLAVPDMADSIWANIGQQLDAGMSPDEGNDPSGNPTPPKGSAGPGKGFYIAAAITVAVTSFFILTHTKEPAQRSIPEQKIIQPDQPNISPEDSSQQTTGSPVERTIKPVIPKVVQQDSTNKINLPVIGSLNADSLTDIPFVIPDTMTVKKEDPPPAIDSTVTQPPPAKKPKGVKGISNDDYKIVGEKNDSTKKKN